MEYGIGIWELLIFVAWICILAVPAYEVAKRCGVASPALAFIPLVGPWMTILASVGTTMWLALMLFVPYLGALCLGIWLALVVPKRHRRNGWWSVAFLIPLANLIAFYAYAYTLEPSPADVSTI